MPSAKRKTTKERGLGWKHQQAVAALKRRHVDGSKCDWCGQAMWLAAEKNWDYQPGIPFSGGLQGDHGEMTRAEAIRRGLEMPPPDRLLHRKCNQQRGDGVNDHLAAASRAKPTARNEDRAMDWPI